LKIDDFAVREFTAMVYRTLEALFEPKHQEKHFFDKLFEADFSIKSLLFIKSRPFLRNYLEKTLLWLLLELFHCKTLVIQLKITLFSIEKAENPEFLAKFFDFMTDFLEKNQLLIEKCSLFLEYEDFLNEKPNEDIEKLRTEWTNLKEKSENNEKASPLVIISQAPMVLNLSQNSIPGSEENSPKNAKDSLYPDDDQSKKSNKTSKSRLIYKEFYEKMNKECHFILEDKAFRVKKTLFFK
jgi:hypothetical protein